MGHRRLDAWLDRMALALLIGFVVGYTVLSTLASKRRL